MRTVLPLSRKPAFLIARPSASTASAMATRDSLEEQARVRSTNCSTHAAFTSSGPSTSVGGARVDDVCVHDPTCQSRDGTAIVENAGEPARGVRAVDISKSLTIRLYASHFLSKWNSRLFEAAVVCFLASIFPNNLLLISVCFLARNVAAIALTVPIGNFIERANRLVVLRASILGQRISVAASCGLFWAMVKRFPSIKFLHGLFAATVVLACVEKVSAGMDLVAIERDWVVVVTEGDEPARKPLNARLRRIDLFCKLLGPLVVALIATASVPVAIYSTLGMNLASVLIEYSCIETVCKFRIALWVERSLKSTMYSAGFRLYVGP